MSPLCGAQNSRGTVSQQPVLLPPFQLPKDRPAPSGNYQAVRANPAEAAEGPRSTLHSGGRQLPLRLVTGNNPERVPGSLCRAAALPVRWAWQDLSGCMATGPFRGRRGRIRTCRVLFAGFARALRNSLLKCGAHAAPIRTLRSLDKAGGAKHALLSRNVSRIAFL